MVLQLFEKDFRFPENLFQTSSIENVQILHWLSNESMPFSETGSYFENLEYRFVE